jgi:hypothetical protein
LNEYAFSLRVNDEAEARAFVAGLPEDVRSQIHLSSRRGLGGDLPQWIMLGTAAAATLKVILTAALRYVELTRIKSIRVAELEVQNPRAQDVEQILKQLSQEDRLTDRYQLGDEDRLSGQVGGDDDDQ